MGTLRQVSRRERLREATYDEIVAISRELLTSAEELSLRAIAGRMGMTAPALYRYVGSYQELVDLVAFEIDKAVTAGFAETAAELPEEDVAGRLIVSAVAFRRWALTRPREFSIVFTNPVAEPSADPSCVRREALTQATSGHYFNGLLTELWATRGYERPSLEDLPPAIREAVLDPLIPASVDEIPAEDRGLLWVFMRGWTALYGVVALEVHGHMDPRIIASGEMFVASMLAFAPQLGLTDDLPRLEALMREHLARGPAAVSATG